MDPTVALEQLRSQVLDLESAIEDDDVALSDLVGMVNDMLDTWEGLDQWMTKGGFRPKQWSPPIGTVA